MTPGAERPRSDERGDDEQSIEQPDARGVVEGAGGVVLDPHGAVLLIRHRGGTWVFPKGHLDPGETHLQAAVREVEEEAGVRARCLEPERTYTTSYTNRRGERRRITWFVLHTDATTPVMREEIHPEGAFFPPEEARRRLSFAEDRALLARALAGEAEPEAPS